MMWTNDPVMDAERYQMELEEQNSHSVFSRQAQAYREIEFLEDREHDTLRIKK